MCVPLDTKAAERTKLETDAHSFITTKLETDAGAVAVALAKQKKKSEQGAKKGEEGVAKGEEGVAKGEEGVKKGEEVHAPITALSQVELKASKRKL